MRHRWLSTMAGIWAAALIVGAGLAQEPGKAAGAQGIVTPTVKDTGGNGESTRSASEYRVKATGEKFKIKETRSGAKVRGTNTKITPVKARKSGVEYKVKETGEKFKVKETRAGARAKGRSVSSRAATPVRATPQVPRAQVTPAVSAPAPVTGAANAGATPAR